MKWISVKDRLPKQDEDVIVSVVGTLYDCRKYQTLIFGAWWAQNEWWYHDNAYFEFKDYKFDPQEKFTVTHWMKYPQLPEIKEINNDVKTDNK